ncbi:hypothetical protein C8R45DRAFT_1036901 [Mycena sanguinolenta]|nr:hypothetical protein C8R45DRAFT_1036901 [Mycena sanguinolenta]
MALVLFSRTLLTLCPSNHAHINETITCSHLICVFAGSRYRHAPSASGSSTTRRGCTSSQTHSLLNPDQTNLLSRPKSDKPHRVPFM